MLLLFASILALLMAVVVFLFAQERRIKYWLALLCLSASMLALGLWVEINNPHLALLAAKSNMTVALLLALSAMVSADIMCQARVSRATYVMLGLAALANIVTVWMNDWYFSGEYIHYSWGGYVAGRTEFLLNPVLVLGTGLSLLATLAKRYKSAHPLDKNRVKYIYFSYIMLSFALLDYLPHFGMDLFGGPVSGVAIPLFVLTFGYANSRYRLLGFGYLAVRISGWVLTMLVLITAYWFVQDLAEQVAGLTLAQTHMLAAAAAVVAFAFLGDNLPNRFARYVRRVETQLRTLIARFSSRIQRIVQENELLTQLDEICMAGIGSSSMAFMDSDTEWIARCNVSSDTVIELEVLRRQSIPFDHNLDLYEVVVPLYHEDRAFALIALGNRQDGQMYSAGLLELLRTLGDVFAMALTNLRHSLELHQRLQLDRFLPPQFVETMLAGDDSLLHQLKRIRITSFFSDLVGFTALSARLPPEELATVLNEYLSAMSDIAFSHGGTIDKFIGDALMVLFGAPVPMNEATQVTSAIKMAQHMYARLDTLNQSWRDRGFLDTDLTCRIGIHCGEATVGSFGSDSRADYTAIGHAVNLASRLEGQCTPGNILLSAATWGLVKDRGEWQAEDRGEIRVKGIREAVRVFEMDGHKDESSA